MKKIIIFLAVFLFISPVYADHPYRIDTKFGMVTIEGPFPAPNDGEVHHLVVGGKVVAVEPGFIDLYEKFSLETSEIILYGMSCGGTACNSYDNLKFLVLSKEKPPNIISTEGFSSQDGTVKPQQIDTTITIDLGFQDGKKKVAIFSEDKLKIISKPLDSLPIPISSCRWLYEEVMDACKSVRSDGCVTPEYNTAQSVVRGIQAISNHPGFVKANFHDACVEACKTGNIADFNAFKKSVCSFK